MSESEGQGTCVVCGDYLGECDCLQVIVCEGCGGVVPGVVCEECAIVVEPVGHWAWPAEWVSEYAVTLERAAAHYQVARPDLAQAISDYRAAWMGRHSIVEEGE